MQKLKSLIRFYWFIFISIALEDWPKKTLLQFRRMFDYVLFWEFHGVMSYI